MDTLPDMTGFSKRKAHELNRAFRKQHLENCNEKRRKEFEEREAAASAAARGPRPKRKRARRADAEADESVIEWIITDYAINAVWEVISERVTPRLLAQEARQAGDPAARPRDFR